MTEQEWLASEDPVTMLRAIDYRNAKILPRGHPFLTLRVSDRKLRLFCLAVTKRMDYGLLPKTMIKLITEAERWVEHGKGSHVDGSGKYVDWKYPLDAASILAGPNKNSPSQKDKAAFLHDIVGNPFRPVKVAVLVDAEVDSWAEPSWLTPQVLSLATAAYEERPWRKCEKCPKWEGVEIREGFDAVQAVINFGKRKKACACGGTGRIENGTLDPLTLLALADALEEAGCHGSSHPCLMCGGHGTLMQAAPDRGPAPICDFCEGTGTKHWPSPILEHLRSPGPHVRGCHVVDLILGKG